MTQPKAKWVEDNRVLRQKNTYFTNQLPLLKKKLTKAEAELETMTDAYRKEINTLNSQLIEATEREDTLQRNFDMLSGLRMEELLRVMSGDRL